MTDRIPVYVVGYPKSGNTWLARLLGDALDSPTGGFRPSGDATEVATEGQDILTVGVPVGERVFPFYPVYRRDGRLLTDSIPVKHLEKMERKGWLSPSTS